MTQGFDDAVTRFSGEVDDAVSRARRAAAEARELNVRLRMETRERPADEPETPPVPQSSDDDADFSQEQIMRRD